jgi:hypothetical protein
MRHCTYPRPRAPATLLACFLGLCGAGWDGNGGARAQNAGDNFRFSTEAEKAQAAEQAEQLQQAQQIEQLVSVPCQHTVKNRRILQLVAERNKDGWQTHQEQYGPFFQVIDARLRALGLKTYTQEQIRQRIAQAEVDAYFNNDPDAALAASKRLAADYVIRGTISSTANVNPVVQVNEVAVSVGLTLSAADGRVLSQVDAHADSYSGSDTLATAVALIREQADRMVAQLYNDYCRKAAGS